LLAGVANMACSPEGQQCARYAGDGVHEGRPPICFQTRLETRPTPQSRFTLYAHFNNTCRYAVECEIRTDVDDRVRNISLPPFDTGTVLIAANTDKQHFDVGLHCFWNP
jgi:hypothetical protein